MSAPRHAEPLRSLCTRLRKCPSDLIAQSFQRITRHEGRAMAFSEMRDETRRELTVIAEGRIDFDAIRAHLARERDVGALGFRELIDARQATPDVTPQEVRLIVDLVRAEARRKVLGPTAVVVSTELAFGMLRMLEQLVEDVALIRPFRDYAAAVEWLATQSGPDDHPRPRLFIA